MKYLNWILEVIVQFIIFIAHIQSEISNIASLVKTDFSCINKTAGFYADTDANCKIYHTCDDYGNKFTYHCPEETAFRQDALICDHAHLVHCHEHTAYNSKYNEEEKNKNLSTKDLIDKKQFVLHVTPSSKTNSKVRYGFILGTKELSGNVTETKIIDHNMTNLHAVNNINSTISLPTSHFMEIKLQHVSLVNNIQENGSLKNENFSVQNQIFNGLNKFNEKDQIDQKDYLNQKTNDTLYNSTKLSRYVFTENIQNQKYNTENDQVIKNTTNLPTLPFVNHRNYPYLETLKSIQKNRHISTITTNTGTDRTSLITTELPVYALTLSLKPLIPGELEHDPYYPKLSTSTEAYYTPVYNKGWSYAKDYTQTRRSSIHFNLPSTLPDLSSLEDIVDRRKLFYIPRIKSN